MANVSYLNVFGGSYLPKISLQDDGKLYFKPTHLGAIHSKVVFISHINNVSHLLLRIRHEYQRYSNGKFLMDTQMYFQ